jgi:hypothetical protein
LFESDFAVFLFVVTAWLFATGGELDDADEPKISSSAIFAQFPKFGSVLPFTVILTYLPLVAANEYFSEFSVVPLLSPLNAVEKVVPSVDVAITK